MQAGDSKTAANNAQAQARRPAVAGEDEDTTMEA